MKAKLVMLVACLCLVFSSFESKAQSCLSFRPVNLSTTCSWSYTLVWNCGGTHTYVNGSVPANTSGLEVNPGTFPNCCTFDKIAIHSPCSPPVSITLNNSNPSGTICDCNGNTVNISLIYSGTNVVGVTLN